MNPVLPLLVLCSAWAFGFDALRKGPESFTGKVKPPVPGYYRLRLTGKNGVEELKFDRELFCTEFVLPGKMPERIQWILEERNFTGLPVSVSGKRAELLFEPGFEERHSFALRVFAENGAEFFLNGKRRAVIPAGAERLVRIPWWEMRPPVSKIEIRLPEDGKLRVAASRLHGTRFRKEAPSNPADSDWPRAVIANGLLKAELALPDPEKGFYRGCRFQSAGMITAFPGFGSNCLPGGRDPRNHDDAAGQAEEFIEVPDFDSHHDVFLKIGVGLLRKSGKSYFQMKNYRIAAFFPWETELYPDRAVFRQKGESPAGFAYSLTKKISLSGNSLVMEYRLENTGKHPFRTTEYAHNFLLPAKIVYPDAEFLPGTKTESIPLGNTRNGSVIANGKTVLRIRETGGEFRRALFRSERGISPEFFRKLNLAPGEYAEWKRIYTVLKTGNKIGE